MEFEGISRGPPKSGGFDEPDSNTDFVGPKSMEKPMGNIEYILSHMNFDDPPSFEVRFHRVLMEFRLRELRASNVWRVRRHRLEYRLRGRKINGENSKAVVIAY